jgi:hypothetical protein
MASQFLLEKHLTDRHLIDTMVVAAMAIPFVRQNFTVEQMSVGKMFSDHKTWYSMKYCVITVHVGHKVLIEIDNNILLIVDSWEGFWTSNSGLTLSTHEILLLVN